jgi:pyridoxamine 5'-phosphate oxidase family protein
MSFTEEEVAYLRSQPVARLATLGGDGQPDVVPVAVEFDGTFLWVGGGATVRHTRKFRNVASGNDNVALVFDDLVSFDPFIARGIRIYGRAEQPFERVSPMIGPGTYLRITPTVSWSWNLAGEPVGETWYASRKAVHQPPPDTGR